MPIDIDDFRVYKGGDPDAIRESERRRFNDVGRVDEIIKLDEQWRKMRGDVDDMRKEKGKISKQIPARKKAKEPIDDLLAASKEASKKIAETEKEMKAVQEKVNNMVKTVGNYVHESVPVFKDEEDENGNDQNVTVSLHLENDRRIAPTLYDGVTPNPLAEKFPNALPSVRPGGGPGGALLQHCDVLARLEGFDAARGVRVAGARTYFMRGVGVALNYALQQYAMRYLVERDYTLLQPPYFMNQSVMGGVAQLAEFNETLYHVTGATGEKNEEDSKYLIATSEQPICGFHMNEWFHEKSLLEKPVQYGGISTCFRKEAGKGGKDIRGIFRVHQFEKIEQFIICHPEKSWEMHEIMSKQAENFTKSLGLPYRVVNIVSGELNNAAAKKYDLEAWFPFENNFRELVSCSNCLDYQSRAMNIRCGEKESKKNNKGKDGKREFTKKKYVHMLNATLCACTRVICCILENYQTPYGVIMPDKIIEFLPPSMLKTDENGKKYLPYTAEYVPPKAEKTNKQKNKKAKKAKKKQQQKKGASVDDVKVGVSDMKV